MPEFWNTNGWIAIILYLAIVFVAYYQKRLITEIHQVSQVELSSSDQNFNFRSFILIFVQVSVLTISWLITLHENTIVSHQIFWFLIGVSILGLTPGILTNLRGYIIYKNTPLQEYLHAISSRNSLSENLEISTQYFFSGLYAFLFVLSGMTIYIGGAFACLLYGRQTQIKRSKEQV